MLLIETFMISRCIVPFHKISERIKFQSVLFVQIEPFLHFSICLRMFHPCFYVLYFFFVESGNYFADFFRHYSSFIHILFHHPKTLKNRLNIDLGCIFLTNASFGVSPHSSSKEPCLSLIHISEPTRLGMISYAVFCLKKKKKCY